MGQINLSFNFYLGMKIIKYLFFIIVLYIFLNDPAFVVVGFNSLKLLFIFAIFFVLFNQKQIVTFKRYKGDLFCYLLLIFYILIRVISGADSGMLKLIIFALIESLILPVFIVRFYFEYLSKFNFYRTILVVGSLGAIISTFCFFIPEINFFFRNIQILSETFMHLENRGYGLSVGLTYSYSISQAIIFYIGIIHLKNNKWFLLIIPMLFISIAFNARIGILILFVSFILFLLQNRKIQSLIYTLLFFGLLFLLFNFIDLESVNGFAFNWVREFFYELNDFFLGTQIATDNTVGTLFSDMYVVPDNISEWIVGRGNTMFGVMGGTDVGYLQLLNYGGLVLIFLYALLVYNMSKQILRYNAPYFLLFFLSILLISEIKGDFIPNTGAFRLICLLYIYIIESKNIYRKNIYTV